MEAITLDDFMSLNDQLAALIRADVPVDLGLPESPDAAAAELERINAVIARRVNRGEPLAEAVENERANLPRQYRAVVEMGFRSGDFAAAVDGSNQLAESVDEERDSIRAALFYPLMICVLAAIGFVGMCWFLAPLFTEVQEGLRLPEGEALTILDRIRVGLAKFGVPALVILGLWLLVIRPFLRNKGRRGSGLLSGALARLTGATHAAYQDRCANFASSLASLTASGAMLEESLPVAGGACGDAKLNHAARELAAALVAGKSLDEAPPASEFPPFLRWALLHSEPVAMRPDALRMAAEVYRQTADRYSQRAKVLAPMLACAFIGGGAVLIYAVALFAPIIHMVHSLALEH